MGTNGTIDDERKKERRSLSEVLREGLPAAPTIGERMIGDDVTNWLCLRLRARAAPTWVCRRRVDGKLIKRKLARFEAMSLDQARLYRDLSRYARRDIWRDNG